MYFFFILPGKRNKKANLDGWCQSEVHWTPAINKNVKVSIYKTVYYFMLFGVQYIDYVSVSGPEESSRSVCHNADKISSNILFQIRQPISLKSLSFSSCDFIIESISTAAPDRLSAFLAVTNFVTSKLEMKINCTSVYL